MRKARSSSITLKDVARHARVGQATAARALGSYGFVSEEVRARVLAAAAELGYQPNHLARSMITRTTLTLGLVLADIENPFFARLARAVADVARLHGYSVLVANTDERLDLEREAAQVFVSKQVDGLIVAPASRTADRYLTDLARRKTPLVLVDRSIDGLDVDTVVVDGAGATYQAIRSLTALGHRRIGLLTASAAISSTVARIDGYRRALAEVGSPPDAWLGLAAGSSSSAAQQAAAALLASAHPPTALFATDSFMTAGAFRAIQAAGLVLPDDISLIGFDDVDWMTMVRPTITVVDQPVYDLGKLAAERLMARIQGDESAAQTYSLEATLIRRGSCAPP